MFSPKTSQTNGKGKDNEQENENDLITDNFDSGSEGDFDVLCNVVYVISYEYDRVTEVVENEDYKEGELGKHKPICYFFMDNGCIEEQNAFFERPHEGMKNHLRPLFIMAKLENTTVKKILVDGGAAVNLMPHFLPEKIGKYDTDLWPHNMVLSSYEGNTGQTMGVIQVDVTVWSITRPTVSMVIASRASYNSLLGREWIH